MDRMFLVLFAACMAFPVEIVRAQASGTVEITLPEAKPGSDAPTEDGLYWIRCIASSYRVNFKSYYSDAAQLSAKNVRELEYANEQRFEKAVSPLIDPAEISWYSFSCRHGITEEELRLSVDGDVRRGVHFDYRPTGLSGDPGSTVPDKAASALPETTVEHDIKDQAVQAALEAEATRREQAGRVEIESRYKQQTEREASMKAEHDRAEKEYEENLQRAREARIRYEQDMAQHEAAQADFRREAAEHEYVVAECAKGNRAVCLGEPSTDWDPNRCVSSPELKQDDTFKGNTSATITNGCPQKVDVRICLKRAGGWNCGVKWGVPPQSTAAYSSFQATGEVFVNARSSGTSKPLAHPAGE